jgi:hypothetical protein
LASLHAIEPNRRPHSTRRIETQSFREVPTGSMACPSGGPVAEAMVVAVIHTKSSIGTTTANSNSFGKI